MNRDSFGDVAAERSWDDARELLVGERIRVLVHHTQISRVVAL